MYKTEIAATEEKLNAIFVTDANEGETGILRNIKSKDKLYVTPPELSTVLDLFEYDFEKKKDIFIGITKHTSEGSQVDRKYTYSSLKTAAKAYSYNLNCKKLFTEVELDNKSWRFMGIYSKNTPSWMITYLGHMYNDITTVSIYDTFGEEGLEYILNLTQMKTIVIQSLFLKRISEMHQQGKIKYLQNLIISDLDLDTMTYESEFSEYLNKNNFSLINLKDFIEEGKEIMSKTENSEETLTRCRPESIILISFTSGSTGVPKGALVSQNGLANQAISILLTHKLNMNYQETHLSYLPYAHAFEQIVFGMSLYLGVNVVYFNGDPLKLGLDLKVASPNFLFTVPRLLLRFYDMIMMKLKLHPEAQNAIQEKLKNLKEKNILHHETYDNIFFNNIRQLIFNRQKINFVLTGSAPIDGNILDFFKIVLGCPVMEGYGMTELLGGLSFTDPNDNISGHVGIPIVSSEFKLIDVPELNYFTTDKDPETGKLMPRGEILARSDFNFEGYLCLKEETDNILDKEDWVHSGDIGQLIEGNRLKIIDRRKNIFKLSQAEYIAPEKIENVLKLCPHIIQSWVYGKSTENYVVALIVLDSHQTTKLASDLKIEVVEPKDLLSNESLIQFLLKEIETTCRNSKLATFEIPKKILLTYDIFTIDNGMLTVTMKAMRSNIRKNWESKVAMLYDS
jgi:long-chain acyl-CoA synthetase